VKARQPFEPTGRPYVVLIGRSVAAQEAEPEQPPNLFGPFETYAVAEAFAESLAGPNGRLGWRGYEITVLWPPEDGAHLY
jgi:hypothetical protein